MNKFNHFAIPLLYFLMFLIVIGFIITSEQVKVLWQTNVDSCQFLVTNKYPVPSYCDQYLVRVK